MISDAAFEQKHDVEQVHFIFVGNAFFIKGGREMLKVLSGFENRYDFKLTLISSLQIHDYFTQAAYEDRLEIQDIIRSKKWIEHYANLSNDRVLEKCREATVGLFPSMADTYGYAVLEMQAAGCPVITTNVRAFPEINNEECGWICHLPVNDQNMCNKEALPELSHQLELELRKCISDILENPHTIKEKGRKAMERIQRMHNPKTYSDTIRSLTG
ncbi:MAG: glycosyltransferase [Lachnospiraceae bacterium]|nr:glycosyltransferase [Lachnospiraceae bacterium]